MGETISDRHVAPRWRGRQGVQNSRGPTTLTLPLLCSALRRLRLSKSSSLSSLSPVLRSVPLRGRTKLFTKAASLPLLCSLSPFSPTISLSLHSRLRRPLGTPTLLKAVATNADAAASASTPTPSHDSVAPTPTPTPTSASASADALSTSAEASTDRSAADSANISQRPRQCHLLRCWGSGSAFAADSQREHLHSRKRPHARSILVTKVMPSTSENLRPRLELDRSAAWIGIKSLIGFLEPPALEEGILESYSIFLDVVLNQVSSDSPVVSYG
ncbi:uncharacterized protein LOC108959116 isoform X2 [Eucalyptus grandis]|uniref:uncharacterized protein LOC108959116 isoform X2 n=1 Tax=Eucalyptus grandis TaxID=71139 RepID=UPI00192EE781|nr:uncharacterized protein LOC108959116 isoform X2 [Eucalyptus grandis]